MKIKWNVDELALLNTDQLHSMDFWHELASRLVPTAEAGMISGLTVDQATALQEALHHHNALDTFMQFSGMACLVGQRKSQTTLDHLTRQLTENHVSQAQAAAEAWLKLLSHDARHLYTVLLHSRLAHESVPADIWRMANELMLKDEIEFQISDIQENNKTLLDQIQSNHLEALKDIEKEQEDIIKCDQEGRLYEGVIQNSKGLDLLLRRPRVSPPRIEVASEEEAKTVLEYIVLQRGMCAIPVIECGTPEPIESINIIKGLLDQVRSHPEGIHDIESFLNPEASAFKAPVLQPKPPTDFES